MTLLSGASGLSEDRTGSPPLLSTEGHERCPEVTDNCLTKTPTHPRARVPARQVSGVTRGLCDCSWFS